MTDILTGIVVFCAAATATACAVAKLIIESGECKIEDRPQFSILHSKFSIHTAVFLLFATVATLSAQKTNSPPLMMVGPPFAMHQLPPSVSPNDVSRGYRLESVATNASYFYAMPTNGVRYGKWWKRGAFEDVFRLDLGGMRFPLKDELLDSLWIYSWGMAGAHLVAMSNRLVATGVPMSAVPGRSEFWSADAAGGAKLLTWEDFFLNRDTNTPVSAQLELYPSGNFIARSNNVERLYHRVNPDDWDDDGIPNDEDDEPLIAGEPAFGASQQLPPGANTNAYCWIDVVVANANSLVTFSGEGNSTLADPSFIARAGETNRVTLLIGKPYHVSSRMPITCVAQSSAAIEVSQDSPTSLSILWPVTIDTVQMRDGLSFSMSVIPDFLGGGFTWTNSCCSISSSGWSFTYSCNDACHCTGCSALGCYTYEGFSLPASGGPCGCSSEVGVDIDSTNEPPVSASVSVSFSQTALFYEETYTNEPGVVVGRRVSTNATFSCSVSGGQYGGVFSLSCGGFDRLLHVVGDTPPGGTVEVAAGETRTWEAVYAPYEHSLAENDISAVATFSEYLSGDVRTNVAHLTVVKLRLEPWATKEGCENRHLVGVREGVNCFASPEIGQWGRMGSGEYGSTNGFARYVCPLTADGSRIYYTVGNSRYDFNLTIVEPVAMFAQPISVVDFGVDTNHAGGVGMNLDVRVLPDTVCFSGIAMEEIPSSTGIHQGYFSNVYFTNVWYHTSEMGAGNWLNIKPDNTWGTDHACMGEEMPRELANGEMSLDMSEGAWSDGVIVWNITWGWAERDWGNGCPPAKAMMTPYNQTFAFDEDGTLTIQKFQHAVSRGTNNVVRLDGNVVQGSLVAPKEQNGQKGND